MIPGTFFGSLSKDPQPALWFPVFIVEKVYDFSHGGTPLFAKFIIGFWICWRLRI